MDDKMLAKLNILLKKKPSVAEYLREQSDAISDDELEQITGGDRCDFSSPCWEDSACQWDSSLSAMLDNKVLAPADDCAETHTHDTVGKP